jgi:hypothetical protein
MGSMLIQFEIDDFDAWKQVFDSDPAGRSQSAKSHTVSRGVDDPRAVFVRVNFDSVEEAHAFRQRLLDSGALPQFGVKMQPTVVEQVEHVTY